MPIDGTKLVPSVKYIAGFDSAGNAKIIDRPVYNGLLGYNGSDEFFMDGSDDLPINLPRLVVTNDAQPCILAVAGDGRIYRFRGASDSVKRYLTSQSGLVTWTTFADLITIPSTGFGILIRDKYTDIENIADPRFINTPGLYYVAADGQVTALPMGDNGQRLTIVNALPVWQSPASGTSAAGAAGVGLDGVVCNNTTAAAVNVRVPKITLVDSTGTEKKASSVNVTADLGAALGIGGLDIGAEVSNKWYYAYVVANSTGDVALCISESTANPDLTNLGDYTFYAQVCVFRNDGGGNIVKFLQYGRDFSTEAITMSEPCGIANRVWGSIAAGTPLTTIIPPSVKTITGLVGGSTSPASTVEVKTLIASTITGLAVQAVGEMNVTIGGFTIDVGGFYRLPIMDPVSPAIYWQGNAASNRRKIQITGYSI